MTRVRGRVLRELPLDDADLDDPSTPQVAPRPTDDPELDQLLASLDPWKLEPPLPGTCRVLAWQGSKRVGPETACDADGSYELELLPGAGGTLHVELLIEGHLRGLLELEVDPGDESHELATVALGPGHRIAGQTLDARGEPLAGVSVQALPQPNLGELVPWRTTSDAEGRFELTTLPFGPVSLRAIKPGYALSVVEAIAPEDAVLMILDALIDLEGEVVGDPELLARAQVRLEGSSVWPAIEQPLDEDGRFVFERLPDGVYGVEVTVPPAAPGEQEYASVPLENVTPDLRVAVALVPAFRVPVRVVDPDGEPVINARVTVSYSQLGMLQKIDETDHEGRARVGPVVPGPYFVQADADGFLPPEPVEIEVGPEGFTDKEQVLVLIRPARLEGVVVDEDDRPVAGAEVWLDSEVAFSVGEESSRRQLFAVAIGASEGSLGVTRGEVPDIPLFADDSGGASLGSVMTDEHGRFEIDLLLPGKHRVWATHGGHAASAVESFKLRSGEIRTGLRLRLREGVPLTGVVRSSNGQPIAGVSIDLGDGLVLTTDDRGVFDAGHRRGKQTLVLRGPGLIPKQVEVDLGKGRGPPVDLELELEPAQGRFEGRVVDGNNQPIADVEVELRPLDGLSASVLTWTDERGLWSFDQLVPGPVELLFEHGSYVPREDRAKVDERAGLGHEIVLDDGWSVAVHVRSEGRGDPLTGVELRAAAPSGKGRSAAATTDKQGLARLDRLTGAAVELEARAPGWVPQRLVVRDDGSDEVEVLVELVEGGSISGTIDDDIGEPVSNASIEVRSPTGELLGQTRSNGRGEWRVEGIRAGDVVVRAEPPPALSAVLAPASVESDVLRGELTSAVRLRFDRP
ncbi:MAG: carboxypeptidase regulatory-like domain-containing protein [Enhygromyxa sp.]